jgi:hypothetical protein
MRIRYLSTDLTVDAAVATAGRVGIHGLAVGERG